MLLKDKGKIIFLEPNLFNPYIYLIFSYESLRKKAHLEPDEMAFSKPFIVEKLKKAGFSNIQVEYRDFLLPGIPESLVKPSIVPSWNCQAGRGPHPGSVAVRWNS